MMPIFIIFFKELFLHCDIIFLYIQIHFLPHTPILYCKAIYRKVITVKIPNLSSTFVKISSKHDGSIFIKYIYVNYIK